MERPLGLVLTGGGALGSWEAGALDGLLAAGLEFDRVIGYSSGALCGAGAFLGRMDELLDRWRRIDEERILRFSPDYGTGSLFSGQSLWDSTSAAKDEDRAKRVGAFEFVVLTVDTQTERFVEHRFWPGGGSHWDGPLQAKLVASSSIPGIFPPVEIEGRLHSDGGIPCSEPMSYASLSHCKDVIVIEMVRPEEAGRNFWNPLRNYEQKGRDSVIGMSQDGVESLLSLKDPPRVHRLRPSTVLEHTMLDFKSRYCLPATAQGRHDAAAFLQTVSV